MSSRRRSGPLLLRAVVVGLALGTSLVVAAPAPARNEVTVEGDTTVITIYIDIVGAQPNLAESTATFWERSIERFWNAGPGGEPFCNPAGGRLEIRADVYVPSPGFSRANAHQITVVETPEEYISNVVSGSDPLTQNFTGHWWSLESGAAIAHEAGHLLGLPDEYTWVDTNKDGIRQPGEPTKPNSGFSGSLMADLGGRPSQTHLDQIAFNHGLVSELQPAVPGKAFPDGRWVARGPFLGTVFSGYGRYSPSTGSFSFTLTVRGGRVLDGTMEFQHAGTSVVTGGFRTNIAIEGEAIMSGRADNVEFTGTQTGTGSVQGIPISISTPVLGSFEPKRISSTEVRGDILLRRSQQTDFGVRAHVAGPFVARKVGSVTEC